jgi:hypothetical protein
MSEEQEGIPTPRPDEAATDEAATEGAATEGAEGGGPAGDEEARVRAMLDELRRLRVEDLALEMAISLVTVGYQKLGLTDQTRELRDLGDARLAIELLRAHLDVLEREGAAARTGDLRSTLAAMQLNYAYVAEERTAPEGAPAAGPESDEPAAAAPAADESPSMDEPAPGGEPAPEGVVPDEPPA